MDTERRDKEIIKPTDINPLNSLGAESNPLALIPTEKEIKRVKATEELPFLPSIKLIQGISKETEEEGITAGDFYISSKALNVGPKVQIVVVQRRAHALLLEGSKKLRETYKYDSLLFQDIALTPDDRASNIVSFSGLGDWLFWLPEHLLFVTYFCGRRSTRPLTDELLDHLTPVAQRTTVLAKEKLFTRNFELYSHFETKLWGNKHRCHTPKVTPIGPEGAKMCDPDPGLLKRAETIFFAPVLKESTLEETNPDIISR